MSMKVTLVITTCPTMRMRMKCYGCWTRSRKSLYKQYQGLYFHIHSHFLCPRSLFVAQGNTKFCITTTSEAMCHLLCPACISRASHLAICELPQERFPGASSTCSTTHGYTHP